jgi:hypothetical protein
MKPIQPVNSSGSMVECGDAVAPPRRARRITYVDERTWAAFSEFKAGITGRKGEGEVARELADLGLPTLHDVLLPDGQGVTQVDHLVRGPDAIAVIETKTYAGSITGTLESAVWMQHLAGGETRYAFQNPFRQNHRHCRAVEALLAGLDVPMFGAIVSAGAATFGGDLQRLIVPIGRLEALFRPSPGRRCDPASLGLAWQRLAEAATAGEPRREEHLEAIRRRKEAVAF